MLTCDICGEEVLLEEDMKTHLLLRHLEDNHHCPLCSLSGVSYDLLCFHVTSAHPEDALTCTMASRRKADGAGGITGGTGDITEARGRTGGAGGITGGTGDITEARGRTGGAGGIAGGTGGITEARCRTGGAGGITGGAGGIAGGTGGITEARCRTGGAGGITGGAGASAVSTDSVPPRQKSTAGVRSSSLSSKTTSESDRCCIHSSKSEQEKSQPQLLPSSGREKLFSCPMCPLVCGSSFILQEHVELHLQDQHSDEGSTQDTCSAASASGLSGRRRFECPMCSVVCRDSFSLQEHVELHLDHSSGSLDSDLQLAAHLQQEEEQRRRQEEAQQEKEEFQKLQRQFGLDGTGGYRRQMERTMERAVASGALPPADFHRHRADMMESLASGVDDGATRTQGVIRALHDYYQTQSPQDCVRVWLSAETHHYSSSGGDRGWGCGYRNLQMLLSSLSNMEPYSAVLQGRAVPGVPRLQSMIEEAWKEGLDPQGSSQFNQRLQGTRAWIGATEIYVLLTSLGISSRIVDFHQATGPAGTHPLLFDWVKQYFGQSSRSSRLPPRLVQTCLPPLYLQHQGHSRSVVGVEQRRNGVLCLLLLDPGCPPSHSRKLLSRETAGGAIRRLRIFPRSLKHRQYQVVAVEGVLSDDEKQTRILQSRTLSAERIP